MQAALDRADRQSETFSNFHFRGVVPVTHHDGGAVGRVERGQHILNLFLLLAADELTFGIGRVDVGNFKGG